MMRINMSWKCDVLCCSLYLLVTFANAATTQNSKSIFFYLWGTGESPKLLHSNCQDHWFLLFFSVILNLVSFSPRLFRLPILSVSFLNNIFQSLTTLINT